MHTLQVLKSEKVSSLLFSLGTINPCVFLLLLYNSVMELLVKDAVKTFCIFKYFGEGAVVGTTC